MKALTVYVAEDGTRFDEPQDCELYENGDLHARVLAKLGLSSNDLDKHFTLRWFVFRLMKAAEIGAVYIDHPSRMEYNHMRKWLEQDQATLVALYQDWLQTQGVRFGRTPGAIHGRLTKLVSEIEATNDRIM